MSPLVRASLDAMTRRDDNEIAIDVRMEFPKPLTDEVVRAADVIVTLGCGDSCPVYPRKRYEDWPIADPAGQSREVVRRIRDDIHHHVTGLLETLTHAPVP
jgi:arsenate reductase